MNRSFATSSLWILAATIVLVAALVPLDPMLSRRAQNLPTAVVAFNGRITDFGTFRWMLYGSGLTAVLAYGLARASSRETVAGKAQAAGRLALYFFLTIGASSVLVHLLKLAIGRARPAADIEEGHLSTFLCHLGNISHRVGGRRLVLDGETETFVGDAEANALLTRKYRPPYVVPETV